MKIIDVGCGPGIYVKALRDSGHEVIGIDPDPKCPERIKSIFDEDGKYDLALCLETYLVIFLTLRVVCNTKLLK